jgi:lysyl-tRNA synthetase, class II
MTISESEVSATESPRWLFRRGSTVRLIVWSTRLVGILAILSVVFPFARRRLRGPVASWLALPEQANVAGALVAVAAGFCLLLLATGLRRHKRRAWQIALLATGLIAMDHLLFHRGATAGITAIALFVGLVVHRDRFTALPDPAVGKWRALLVFAQLLTAGVVVNLLILVANHRHAIGRPSFGDELTRAVLALVGVSGPVTFHMEFLDDLSAAVGLLFGLGAALVGGYLLLRSAEPMPSLGGDDETRIRALLDAHGGGDSLGYFALRRDKSVVFSASGKSALTYRVLAGVALTSGDPLGDGEAWPGAIDEYLRTCVRHGWVPAVLGCSERAATVWARYGLTVLELGDEAVVESATFSLEGRRMRGVRQAVARVRRSGYEVRVRRSGDIAEPHHAELARLADRWRGTETERGFSMALSRLADVQDPRCVVVTAEQAGVVRGMLQFVPWGDDGLSLDLMRRDRDVPDNGLNEFMITELLSACPGLGVHTVSLNFAMFRAALERGERIGAGPVARLWAKALRLGSRWWQIESLYRFNAKFQPQWIPRYLVFPAVRDLPRIVLAAAEAEGFGGRPPALLRMLRRT